jgi:3-oxoacyl-(acyl-carrier-protein) synthase/NAD(P)-dependent dehydrogenase (short-subunit alcohol dehydrogenase family)
VYGVGPRPQPLGVASCAPWLGYLGAASGLGSLVAAALAVTRGERPGGALGKARSFSVDTPAGRIAIVAGGVGRIRHAGVSSPGLGGVVYHALLSAPDEPVTPASRVASITAARPEEDRRLAIVGLGAILPGAQDPEALWRAVCEGRDAIGPFPRERWDPELYRPAPHLELPQPFRAGCVPLPRPDPARWRMPPASLPSIDGAVLLALAACEQAVRDAGYRPGAWDPERVGVIVGHLPLRAGEYEAGRSALVTRQLALTTHALRECRLDEERYQAACAALAQALMGSVRPIDEDSLDAFSSLTCAARVAARFDFRGEALAVDGACASSLGALGRAAQALEAGELDVAVVAATAYNLVPEYYLGLALLGAINRSGRRPFEEGSDGMTPGEGAGALVLKRLADARRDGDPIYALLAGVGQASDGRGAFLCTNPLGQERALRRAYAQAGVAPAAVDLVEAHGTGTQAGDAVELETYATVYAERDRTRPIVLGSVKSNIGHLSSAAGLAGLLKATLALHRRVLPPSLHDGSRDPARPPLVWAHGTLHLGREACPWPDPPEGSPRRAGVSGFGMGGINLHVVLEEADAGLRDIARRPALPEVEREAQRLGIDVVPVARPATRDPRMLPSGAAVLVVRGAGQPSDRIARALADRLAARGNRVIPWEPPRPAGIEEVAAAVRALLAEAGARGIAGAVDLTSFEAEEARADAVALTVVRRATGLVRALHEVLAAESAVSRPFLVALTGMGGRLGIEGGAAAATSLAAGGAWTGFMKGLKQELPGLVARVVDVEAGESPAWIAETVLAELLAGGDRVEVGYHERRRFVPRLRLLPHGPQRPQDAGRAQMLGRHAVVLCSGGGRGVVFECARALARTGARVIVTGRLPPSRGDEPWLTVGEDEFLRIGQETLRTRDTSGWLGLDPDATPAQIRRRWEALASLRALHHNLASARAAGERVEYLRCDVTDGAAVGALVAEVRRRWGRITGLVHGAMVEHSRAIADKPVPIVEATVLTKLGGLEHLLEHLPHDEERLDFIVAFGSIAGRLGNHGQADYCAANDALAKVLGRVAEERPGTRCVTIDWGAWARVGGAAAPHAAERLRKAGVSFFEPEEGAAWFVEEIERGAPGVREVVIGSERMVRAWPWAAEVHEATAAPVTLLDDVGRPLVAGHWPLVDQALGPGVGPGQSPWSGSTGPGATTVLRRLSVAEDPFLEEHRVYDAPMLPGAFALEMLAEAAALACSGETLCEVRDFILHGPLRPGREDPLVRVEVRAVEAGPGNERVCTARALIDGVPGPGPRGVGRRLLFEGTVVLGEPREGGEATERIAPSRSEGTRGASRYETLRWPIRLGPSFRRLAWVECTAAGARGALRTIDERRLFGRTTAPRLIADPLLLDVAFQVATHHAMNGADGAASVPVGIGRIVFPRSFQDRRLAERHVLIEAERQEERGEELWYRLRVHDGSEVLLAIDDLRMRRIERMSDAVSTP